MKKRILCFLLVLVTLLSTLPTLSVAADEVLPKDETPGAPSAITEDGAALTVYDSLYVGADGGKTANGGTLVALYSAFGADLSSVSFTAGTWADKLGGEAATLRGSGWTAGVNGGFGYDFPMSEMTVSSGNYGVSLPVTLLTPNLYVETVGMVKAYRNADGTIVNVGTDPKAVFYNNKSTCYASFTRIDLLSSVFFIAADRSGSEGFGNRWHLCYKPFPQHFGKEGIAVTNNDNAYSAAILANGKKPTVLGAYYERKTAADGTETYTVGFLSGGKYEKSITAAQKSELTAGKAISADKAGMFSFFNGVPSDVYAIRVYSAPLTDAERQQNAAADVLAYAGASLTEYLALSATVRATVNGMLASIGFGDKESTEKVLDDLLTIFKSDVDVKDTFYVTENLTFFASAYKNLSTGHVGEGSLSWINAPNPTESASLRGGFVPGENGGYTVVKTAEEYAANKAFGIYMPGSVLPDEDYTVEIAYNPVGLSQTDENGKLERYIDDVTSTGTHHNRGIAIGPLRALQFSCYRPAGRDGQMERRWYYIAKGDINNLGWKYDFKDTAWQNLGLDEVTVLSITHDFVDGGSNYMLYNNASLLQNYQVSADKYIDPNDAEGKRFELLLGMAGTAYSIRVYDRPLTASEVAQNKLADLIYYYDLDASLITSLIETMGASSYLVYDALNTLDFSVPRDEAQQMLDNTVVAIWIHYSGLGVRKEAARDGIRYYFDISSAAAGAMSQTGYAVEMGALVNVGKNVAPTLEGDFDYMIHAYDSVSGRNTSFFVDEDTFGVTVNYKDLDKAAALTNVLVRGYVKLTDAQGNETVYYTDAAADDYDASKLFYVYESMKYNEAVKESSETITRIKDALDRCYEKVSVYVDAAAAVGGNGSKDAPYRGFAQGFASVKTMLAKTNAPTRYYLVLADGEYGVYETQSLTDADMPFFYSSLEITSVNGKSTLTTTKNIDKSFTEYADNVWVCQLDKEADGSYPCFRYLYVDGKIADLAYNGARYSSDSNPYVSMYERTFDGPWGKAEEMYKVGVLTESSVSDYPESRPDLIAAFEGYKQDFLALMEMERQHVAGQLTLDSTCESEDADYIAQYEAFKMRRLVLDDLKKQYGALDGTPAQNKSAFGQLQPKDYNSSAYNSAFVALRQTIASQESISFDPYEPMVESDARLQSKYYVNLELVGDLRAEMAAGKERQKKAYDDLKDKYDAASAAEKAEMEAELAKAALRVGEFTWFRYALEGYGPEVFQAGQWWHNIVHVAGVDYEDTVQDKNGDTHVAIYFEADEYANYFIHGNYSMVGRYVFMKNALAYVDQNGEYYYDEAAGKVYYYSEDGVNGLSFARGTHDYMFTLSDVRNVTFSDLHVTGVDDAYLSHNDGCVSLDNMGATGEAYDQHSQVDVFDRSAILLEDCHDITVSGCTFDELGARAIFGRDILKNIVIESNVFERIGAGAIHFGRGTNQRTWALGKSEFENIIITDNYIHDMAREYYSSVALWLSFGKDVEVTHNTIEKCSYTAIGIGFTYGIPGFNPDSGAYHLYNIDVSYNYVTGFMHEIGDGGGIYLSGGSAKKDYLGYFNFVHDNYILMSNTTGNGLGHMIVGIYFDGSASNWMCNENVIVEQSYGAVSGEDENFDLDDEETVKYLKALRNRYRGSTFIYIQHIMSQITHNIWCDNNYILNVRATDPALQQKEVYKSYIVADRNIKETNTRYVNGIDRIPIGAEDIIYAAGSYGHEGDPYVLYDNNY